MSQTISFDYFYGGQSDAFSYYRIPRLLITGQQFKGLSTDAKLLYGLLLDRMGLSSRNGWYDELGRVYIYYPLDEIQADLNCGHDKAVKLLALLLMLSPFAPHIVEEMWENLGFANAGMACVQSWPAYDESKTMDAEVTIAVQVCGKMKGTIQVPMDSEEEAVAAAAQADAKVARAIEGKNLVKVIYVKNRLINLIAK